MSIHSRNHEFEQLVKSPDKTPDIERQLAAILVRLETIDHRLSSLRSVNAVEAAYGKTADTASCEISFISPCFNEVGSIEELHARITESCAKARIENYEIVWIENGSTDGSIEIMRQLQARDPRVRIIRLSRNFGYQGAITCGLVNARGEYVAILDGDIQDPPELIPLMLKEAKAGQVDVVYGVRATRQEGLWKRTCYAAFYRIWSSIADIKVPLDAGDFCVMHRRVVESISAMPERQRFIRGLRAWSGFRQAPFSYERDARRAGEPKFNLPGMVNLALDGLISYSVLPLRVAMASGAVVVALALCLSMLQAVFRLLAYAGLVHVEGILPPGLTQINVMVVGLIGLNVLFVGLVGEYVGRVYTEVKDRPLYIVAERLE